MKKVVTLDDVLPDGQFLQAVLINQLNETNPMGGPTPKKSRKRAMNEITVAGKSRPVTRFSILMAADSYRDGLRNFSSSRVSNIGISCVGR